MLASVRPSAAAAWRFTVTSIRGELLARSVVTSATSGVPATAARTCSAAVSSAAASSAFTITWIWVAEKPPPPPPASTFISPASGIALSVWRSESCMAMTSTPSAMVTEKVALFAPPPPNPKMPPLEPIVTW